MSTNASLSVSQLPQGVVPERAPTFKVGKWSIPPQEKPNLPTYHFKDGVDEEEPTTVEWGQARVKRIVRLAAAETDFVETGVPPVMNKLPASEFAEVMREHSNPPRCVVKEESKASLSDSLDCQVGEVAPEEEGATVVDIEQKLQIQPQTQLSSRVLQTTCAFLALIVVVLGGLVARKFQVAAHNVTVTTTLQAALLDQHPTLWVPPLAAIPDEEPPPRMVRLRMDGLTEIPPLRTLGDEAQELPPPAPQSTFHVDMDF